SIEAAAAASMVGIVNNAYQEPWPTLSSSICSTLMRGHPSRFQQWLKSHMRVHASKSAARFSVLRTQERGLDVLGPAAHRRWREGHDPPGSWNGVSRRGASPHAPRGIHWRRDRYAPARAGHVLARAPR